MSARLGVNGRRTGRRRRCSGRVGWTSWILLLPCAACAPGQEAPTLDLPPRPGDAPGGAEIVRELRALDFEEREERIYAEVARGNVPDRLRKLERVEIPAEIDGRTRRVTTWVTPDYLSVGADTDHFLTPLSARTAQRIADLVGGSLPTPRMVDAVWESARVRFVPIRLLPDEDIITMRYFERHNRLVQAQRWLRGGHPGVLVAGHKLDVVLTARPGTDAAVALYGWHLIDGTPIQPLHMVSGDRQPHFSMGVRLVHRDILVDGVAMDLSDVLRDPKLAPVLSEPMRWRSSSRAMPAQPVASQLRVGVAATPGARVSP